jgi:hypothetical protein
MTRTTLRNTTRRILPGLERLEDRTVPAGNVSTFLSDGDLFVYGDAAANGIMISQWDEDTVLVSSWDGTTTINGTPGPAIFNDFDGDVFVSTGAGPDSLSLIGLEVDGTLDIRTGAGNDSVWLTAVTSDRFMIKAGTGFDILNRNGSNLGPSLIVNVEGKAALPVVTARADVAVVAEGGTATINVAANDSVSIGQLDLASIVITQGPTNGFATANFDGTVTYTHNGTETTSDFFRYRISDLQGNLSAETTVNVTVTPVNDLPLAVNDIGTVAEGGTVTVNVAANDSDADGTLNLNTVVITQQPTNGTATVTGNGNISFQHNGSETTTATIKYTIQDSQGAVSNAGTVNITVTPVNDVPVAVNDTFTVNEGASATLTVAANDTDAEGQLNLKSITIIQQPTNGTVTVDANGVLTFTHNGSETTASTFTYTIADQQGSVSNTATVNVTITPVNDAPIALNDTFTVNEGGSATLTLATNDTDAEGQLDLKSIAIVQQPTNGTVTVDANGVVTFTHNGSETTSSVFTYTIADTQGKVSNTATVNVTITPINDNPIALNDTFTINEGASATINIAGNDTDAEGQLDLTSIVITSGPTNGTAKVNADGTVTFTHNGSETTSATFSYTIEDLQNNISNVGTVTINVNPVNDPPIANADSATVNNKSSVVVNLATNDTDAEGQLDANSIVIVSGPANGTVTVGAGGNVTYTHDGSATLSDTFTYTIEDLQNNVSSAGTVTITVNPA